MERNFSEVAKFRESDKSPNTELGEWGQFKDPFSHMYLDGTVVAFWSLTQKVAGLKPFCCVDK